LATLLAAGMGAWFLSGGPFEMMRAPFERADGTSELDRHSERRALRHELREARRAGKDPVRVLEHRRERGISIEPPPAMARAFWLALLVAVLISGSIIGSRARQRRRRRMTRRRIVFYRAEEATPAEVRSVFEGWHAELLADWWRRPLLGQAGIALEHACLPGEAGPRVEHYLACEEDPALLRSLEARLRTAYPDARLEPISGSRRFPCRAIMRLKKEHTFTRRLTTNEQDEGYERALTDSLIGAMAATEEPVLVQLCLIPAPGVVELLARSLFRSRELTGVGIDGRQRRSELLERELEGGLEVQHRSLYFADIRVAAETWGAARQVARTLVGDSRAENVLQDRRVKARRDIYRARIARAQMNPVPSLRLGVLSTSELAALWQAPSPFLKAVPLERSARPRVAAAPEVLRPLAALALGHDELGPVGIRPEDRARQVAVLGVPGMGKSSFLARAIAADAGDPNCCVIVLDPKGDLHDAALTAIPERRRTNILSFHRPEMGVNPFRSAGGLSAMADGIVEALKAIHDEGSIQASSERYLHDTALAVGAVEDAPSFHDQFRAVMPDEAAYRRHLVEAMGEARELNSAVNFLGKQLPAQLAKAEAAFVQRMDAPANKLQLLMRPAADAVFRHPVSLDIDRAIRERRCVVINGASEERALTEAGLQLVLNMIHQSLVRQQLRLPEAERVRVALYLDEAHILFSSTFVRMLAMDRSAGLQVMAAWQSLSQIEELSTRRQVLDLLNHYVVFQVGTDDARELAKQFQSVYTDTVRDDERSRRRPRIGVEALANMPRFCAGAALVAGGARAPGFVLETYPLEIDPARIVAHQEAQRHRDGAHYHGAPEISSFAGGERPATRDTPTGARETADAEPRETVDEQADLRKPEPQAPRPARSSSRASPAPSVSEPPDVGETAAETSRPEWSGQDDRDRETVVDRSVSEAPTSRPSEPLREPAPDTADSSMRRPRDSVHVALLGSPVSGLEVPPAYTELEVFERAAGAPRWEEPRRERQKRAKNAEEARRRAEEALSETLERRDRVRGRRASDPTAVSKRDQELAVVDREIEALRAKGRLAASEAEKATLALERWRAKAPLGYELDVIEALGESRYLYGPQIERGVMRGTPARTVRQRLGTMHERGWVKRWRVPTGQGSWSAWVYMLTKEGFELGKGHRGERGHRIHPERKWHDPATNEVGRMAVHDLHVNAWREAFAAVAGPTLSHSKGAGGARLYPPRRPRPRERHPRAIGPAEVELGSNQRLEGFEELNEFRPVEPDLRLTLEVSIGTARTIDVLVELDRSRRGRYNEQKLAAYDALLGAWAMELDRYKRLGEPPVVIFVCVDEPRAKALAYAADRIVTGGLTTLGRGSERTGRMRMWFCAERDAHLGSLRAYRLPQNPPARRRELGEGEEPNLEQREFIASEYLRRHAAIR